jgi:hypothetical protein
MHDAAALAIVDDARLSASEVCSESKVTESFHHKVFARTKGTETSMKQPRNLCNTRSLAREANLAPHLAKNIELMDMRAAKTISQQHIYTYI